MSLASKNHLLNVLKKLEKNCWLQLTSSRFFASASKILVVLKVFAKFIGKQVIWIPGNLKYWCQELKAHEKSIPFWRRSPAEKSPAFSVTFGCSCSFFSSLVQILVGSSSLDRKVGLASWQFTLKWKKLQEILWAYQWLGCSQLASTYQQLGDAAPHMTAHSVQFSLSLCFSSKHQSGP